MYEDLSNSSGMTAWSKSQVEVAKNTTLVVDTVEAPIGYATSITWDFIISDEYGGVMRAGTARAVVSSGNRLLTEVPHSIVEATPIGVGASNVLLKIVRTAEEVISLRVESTYSAKVTVSLEAKRFIVPLEANVPKIQLTISGLTGGHTFNGMDDGVHLLTPDYYNRIETTEVSTYTDALFNGSSSVSSSTAVEMWRHGYCNVGEAEEDEGHLGFFSKASATSGLSWNQIKWRRGTATQTGGTSFATTTSPAGYGALRDQVLSDSWTYDGVTFQWQRAPGQSGVWANY
jgi:hypothetical protein